MRLSAVGGLCNRLRTILGYYREHPALTVVWRPDADVTGARFPDYFEPIPGVTFEDKGRYDVEACNAPSGVTPLWEALRPTARVERAVRGVQHVIGEPYVQIHVRRTDVTPLAPVLGHFTTDHEFQSFVGSHEGPVYISCDNRESQERFARFFESRGREVFLPPFLLTGREIQDMNDHTRHAGMFQSVVNLYMGVGARVFMGSFGSSGTETIHALRALRGSA